MPKLVKDNTYTQTHFAARLNQLLQDNRVTQDELAKYVGITRQTVSSWKDGKTVPDIESLYRICKRFDISADYLIGLSETTRYSVARGVSRVRRTKSDIGDRIRELRDQKGLTQNELAVEIKKQFGVSVKRETVAYWENGTRDLKTDYTIILAKCLGSTSDYILGLSDDPSRTPSAVDELGLTLEACEILKKKKGYPRYGEFISEVIKVGTILAP